MNTTATLNSIKNLHMVVENNNKEKQRCLQMIAEMGKELTQLRSEREMLTQELGKTRKELASSKTLVNQLNKTVSDLRQEVQVMVAAIDMANMEIAEADNSLMDVATTIYSDFKASKTKSDTVRPAQNNATPAPVAAVPVQDKNSAPPLNFTQQSQTPPRPVAHATPQMNSSVIEGGFKEIERLLSETLNK